LRDSSRAIRDVREALGNSDGTRQRLVAIELLAFPPERFANLFRAFRDRLKDSPIGRAYAMTTSAGLDAEANIAIIATNRK
jgi:hypothetical protein